MDLVELFNTLPAWRAFNVIDSIIIDEAARDGEVNGGIEKARTQILSMYGHKSSSTTKAYDEEEEFFREWDNPGDGEFHEGLKVTNSSKFRLEPALDDGDDGISPFA